MLGLLPYLYRLVPGNPILLRVIATASKRRRDLITRCVYLGLLIAIVLWSLLTQQGASGSLTQLTKTSAQLFESLSFLQLALVALLAPVFTAGAITQERDSQTYDILLSTPLTNGQIVLGTLLSRVFFVVALLVSGVPVFSITQIFGGVAINAIVMSFLIAAATALVTGALAIAIATLKVGTRKTIFYFYLFIAVYLVGGMLLDRLPEMKVPLVDGKSAGTSWITGLHPFLALQVLFNRPEYLPPDPALLPTHLRAWPLGWYLASPASFYVTATTGLSLALVLPSIVLLRKLAQTTLSPGKWVLTTLRISTGDRTRAPRSVWHNPIAWREAKTKGSAARATLLRYGLITAGSVGALVVLVGYMQSTTAPQVIRPSDFDRTNSVLFVTSGDKAVPLNVPANVVVSLVDPDGRNPRPFSLEAVRATMGVHTLTYTGSRQDTLGTLALYDIPRRLPVDKVRQLLMGLVLVQAAVILLVVTNTAASTVTREKEDGTLDLLLTTPITSRYYVWGKLRGLVYFVLPLIAVPVASVAVFVLADGFTALTGNLTQWAVFPEAVLVMPAVLVILAAFAAITGMIFSLRSKTTVRAVMASVAVVLGVCGAMGLCGNRLLLGVSSDSLPALAVAAFSPFTVLMLLTAPQQFGGTLYTQPDLTPGARITLFIFALAATAAYAAVVWQMYKAMVKNFDMTIRKQSR